MEATTNTKTLTQILQELISLHTAKKETAENTNQSNTFIKELLNELSLSGDAVSSDVDNALNNETASADINVALKNAYQEALSSNNLPASVQTLLTKQLNTLT